MVLVVRFRKESQKHEQMIYLLTSLLFYIGVGFHIMQKVSALKTKYENKVERSVIWSTFFKEEWDSLIVSALVWMVLTVALVVVEYNKLALPDWLTNWGLFISSLVLGYSGQRIAYKYLTTAEQALDKKIQGVNIP